MRRLSLLLITLLFTGYSHAAGMNAKDIYFGGGLGFNSISGIDLSDGLGFQFFAGYDLPVKMGTGKLSLEAGYMDSGNMEFGTLPPPFPPIVIEGKATGLWGNAVYSLPLNNNLTVLGRLGLDIGDDDGVMFGAGMGYQLDQKMELRAEYVIRDTIDSLQFNLVIRQ